MLSEDIEPSISGNAVTDLIRELAVGTLRVDGDGRVVDLNAAAASLIGMAVEDVRGQALANVYRLSRTRAEGREPQDAGTAAEAMLLIRPDGAELSIRERKIPIRSGGWWLVVEDVTELTALRREQEWLTFHDPVTNLPNRRALERQLAVALQGAQGKQVRYAFGYLDVDELNEIVDTFGLTAGDEVLRQIAGRIRRKLGPNDFLARLGEARFGLILEAGERGSDLDNRAQALRRSIAEAPFVWHQDSFHLGASVGVVPIMGSTAGLETVLAAADAATSMAKDESIAIHEFDASNSIDLDLADHYGDLRWLARIHRALKQRRFHLYRQPIVEASGTTIVMYEVLLRMEGENGEIVLPGRFIPAAERFHLISTLDRWVVRNALASLSKEREAITIAINLSGESLSDRRFLDDVVSAIETSGVDPKQVAFEITETAAVGSLRRARRFIHTLRSRGCRFILDDFGRGLSSFGYLQDLPIDFIKIDGAFVQGMATSKVAHAIVTAIHHVASILGIRTIAEFVEDERVREQVAALGVDLVQGFGIGMPAPWKAPMDAKNESVYKK